MQSLFLRLLSWTELEFADVGEGLIQVQKLSDQLAVGCPRPGCVIQGAYEFLDERYAGDEVTC